MAEYPAPGLPADWLNAWLAALGITVLLPDLALRWTDDPLPHAVLVGNVDRLPARIAETLPGPHDVAAYAIATNHPETTAPFTRKVTTGVFHERAGVARRHGDFTLQSTVTDLGEIRDDGTVPHSPFDPPAPKGLTIFDRVTACTAAVNATLDAWAAVTLAGTAHRVAMNGLGFDYRRIVAPTEYSSGPLVDPMLEAMCFLGLSFTPIRGDGARDATRGWSRTHGKGQVFEWCAWREPLTAPAIDAVLGRLWNGDPPPTLLARYRSVAYQPKGSSDVTRAFASERIG